MCTPSTPGTPGLDGLLGRPHGRVDHGQVVADQGRQEAGGPVGSVRGPDGGDRLDRGGVVEQHPAAAIDLGVDEAGDQQAAVQVVAAMPAWGRGGAVEEPSIRPSRIVTALPSTIPSGVRMRPLTRMDCIRRFL
jgi:hypothetical protein